MKFLAAACSQVAPSTIYTVINTENAQIYTHHVLHTKYHHSIISRKPDLHQPQFNIAHNYKKNGTNHRDLRESYSICWYSEADKLDIVPYAYYQATILP